jgi:3-hydroxypropanoate dehydrogenase
MGCGEDNLEFQIGGLGAGRETLTFVEESDPMSDDTLNRLFLGARTHNGWQDRPVDEAILRQLYDLLRMGPTAANTQPLRVAFVTSGEAKDKLKPALSPGNVDKTMQAPVTAIIAWDTAFYAKMPKLFPDRPGMAEALGGMPEDRREKMGVQSATLQAGYLILAARALGLDAGPMGGFDAAKVDAAFFADGRWRSTLLINLGYGDSTKLFPRNPRLDFDEACVIV